MQKSLPFAALLMALTIAATVLFNLSVDSQSKWPEKVAFEDWKARFGKIYKSNSENLYRFGIFHQNFFLIKEHNQKYDQGEVFSQLRLNHFSDLTVEEFKKSYLSEHEAKADFACTAPAHPKKTSFNDTFYVDESKNDINL